MCPKRSLYSWSLQRGTRLSLCPHSCKGQSAQSLRRELSLLCCLHSINAEGRKEGGQEKLPELGAGRAFFVPVSPMWAVSQGLHGKRGPAVPREQHARSCFWPGFSHERGLCIPPPSTWVPVCVCVGGGVLAEGICSTVTYLDTCMKNKFPLKSWEPQ